MIGTYYGYNPGYYGYGYPSATATAMQAYQNYANQAYGVNFDQFAMTNPYGGYYNQILQSHQQARQQVLQQRGLQPPPNWETMPLEDFLQWAARQRQVQGPTKPPVTTPGGQPSPLGVNAHAYTNSQGETVPVRYVRVNETGNYNSRQRFDNPAGYTNYNATYGQARLGRTYTVTVEWADGRTQTTQVVNRGWPVEVW